MRVGEIELIDVGAHQVVAIWGHERLSPDSLVECDAGTLTAAEYVAFKAIREGKGGHSQVARFCSALPDVGFIDQADAVTLH